jgi:hypothetical protein
MMAVKPVIADFPDFGFCEATNKVHTSADRPCYTTIELQGGVVAMHASFDRLG